MCPYPNEELSVAASLLGKGPQRLVLDTLTRTQQSVLEKGVVTKGVFSLDRSLESLKSLESPLFPHSGGSLESLESLDSL